MRWLGRAQGVGCLAAVCLWGDALPAQIPHPNDAPLLLDPVIASTAADRSGDPTGMGSAEAELDEPPFTNELVPGERADDEAVAELGNELQFAAGVTPADLATGVNRVNLRGFPTPRLRNGFTQIGIPDILGVERVELIQGPLTPVIGRAAPGGIQNFVTARPRARPERRLAFSGSTQRDAAGRLELTGPLVPKKVWHRVAAGWSQRVGPENYARHRSSFASGSVTYKHSAALSVMASLDFQELAANPSSGVPEYRLTTGGKILGPYRPLAYFHVYGPAAGVRKQVTSGSLQVDAQASRHISVRAAVQGWSRRLVEDRFTTGQYIVDLGRFGGTREPQHTEQPLDAVAAGAEATARFHAWKADHKFSVVVGRSQTDYTRVQRALERADRDALPADVRAFDPHAPNYYHPTYSPELFRRILTDRAERASYTEVSVSERAAFLRGRLVVSGGLRFDWVKLDLRDRRTGAAMPHVSDRVDEITRHFGANYQVKPGKLLVFANTSTAFEPSTRVDARTGRIQGNETTLGFETGAKALFLKNRVSATLLLFRFFNQNISRRNPLYDDPIADVNQTQPQLVAAGEERFTGATLDLRGQVTPRLTLSTRATFTEAITTASPDIPEEIGRELPRLPPATFALSSRYGWNQGRWTGLSAGCSLTWVRGYVGNYESASRFHLEYPAYALWGANLGYSWKAKKRFSQSVGVSLSNLFDKDLLAVLARPGAGRHWAGSYSLGF